MREQFLCDKHMYDFNNGLCCGVVVPENVMRELVKLSYKYSNEAKKILNEHKSEIYSSSWTIANKMKGKNIEKQVLIKYALKAPEKWDGVDARIKSFMFGQPEYIKDFYIVDTREQAKDIAEEVLKDGIIAER